MIRFVADAAANGIHNPAFSVPQPPGFDLTDAQQLPQAMEYVRPWIEYCVRQPVIVNRAHRQEFPRFQVTPYQPSVRDFERLLRECEFPM